MNKYKLILLLAIIIFSHVISALVKQNDGIDLQKQIDSYFTELAENGFSGAVLVSKDNKIILQNGYGLANTPENISIKIDTVFDIGSISKQFTASAILYLEQQGLLNVEDPISKYFKNVPSDKENITIHQLLTHSAGFTQDHFENDLTRLSKEDALQAIFNLPLGFEPGTQYTYSNTGYTVLAMLVENISGQSFTAFMHQTFFEPLGMSQTGFYNDSWDNQLVANTYLNRMNQGNPSEWDGPYWGVMGNGGVMSTVGDLYIWWQTLQTYTVLSEQQTEKLFTRHISEGSDDSFYGYGWSVQDSAYGNLITHNGGGIGGNSDFAVYTDEELLIIICSNQITWKTLFDTIPYEIRLPATEAREQLVENISSGDFSKKSKHTFLLMPYLIMLTIFLILVGAGVKVLMKRRKNRHYESY